ncbi:MAG: acetylxylan esterase [Bacteroidetes bacterium]|nr:acetylxylan esterase [Bacteroidota bacterium]
MNRFSICIFFLFLFAANAFAQEYNTSVFHSNSETKKWLLFEHNNQALYTIITNEAFKLLDEREAKIAKLETKEDWKNYQTNLHSKLFVSIDKFKKTPLNAKVTKKIKGETFTVEKILFESHPNFYVTGCLFIPKERQKPAPAVIYCSGHTELGFRSDVYQHVILNLVEKGFVVFAFDPIGQGERLQYLDPETGKSKIGGPTSEHTFAGVQTLLCGTSLSDYFIWDGVRAVDFLETRKEVDIKRIGITGRSGGGTQSAMIAAYDKRIYAAAPECYVTNFKRLLQSIGPQDAEQNPFNAIKLGFDHPDFLHLRAPKPSLLVTTTHDFFSQQGARESYAEAQKSYAALNAIDNIQMVEDFGIHESTKNNRESVYAFFQKHLNNPGNNTDNEVLLFKPEELWVTPTGQLQSSIKGETIFNLNQKYFVKEEVKGAELKTKIAELSGIEFKRKMTAAVFTGKIITEDLVVEKYFLENDKRDFALPVIVIQNKNPKPNKILIWLNPKGKEQIFLNENSSTFLDAGYTIISADLPGIGELHDPEFKGDGFIKSVPFNLTFGAHLTGKTIPGIQAEAIDLLMQFVTQKNTAQKNIHALVEGVSNSAFLHYTTFQNPFSKIVFLNPTEAAADLIGNEYYNVEAAFNTVPGSIPYYDFKTLKSFLPFYSNKTVKWDDESDRSGEKAFGEVLELLRK